MDLKMSMLTSEATKEYYKSNKDFKEYIDRYSRCRRIPVEECFSHNICRTTAWVYKTWEIDKYGYENTNKSN